MQELADGTGGIFFHNDNDLKAGLDQLAAHPEFIYILGFSPQNLKLDGSFHSLKVTVRNISSPTLQARRGYWAPNHVIDAAEAAKEELREDVFSREEIHDIPVDLHTEFFKSSEDKAELTVTALLNPDNLRFQKAAERNNDTVTVVTGLFDGNGNYVSGVQRVVQLHLRDQTLTALRNDGISVEETFTVPPGRYFVRLVIQDAGGQTTAARNGGVEIPVIITRSGRCSLLVAGVAWAAAKLGYPNGDARGAGGRDRDRKERRVCSRSQRQGFSRLGRQQAAGTPERDLRVVAVPEPRLVLFFDETSMDVRDQIATRQAASGFIDAGTGPNRRMAVVSYDGIVRDSPELHRQRRASEGRASEAKCIGSGEPGVRKVDCDAFRRCSSRECGRAQHDLGSRESRGKPGRFAGAKDRRAIRRPSSSSANQRSDMSKAIEECNRSGVAIYPVDVRPVFIQTHPSPSAGRSALDQSRKARMTAPSLAGPD